MSKNCILYLKFTQTSPMGLSIYKSVMGRILHTVYIRYLKYLLGIGIIIRM